ncbi:hypothetical protein D3C81_846530 [compost metagenome]
MLKESNSFSKSKETAKDEGYIEIIKELCYRLRILTTNEVLNQATELQDIMGLSMADNLEMTDIVERIKTTWSDTTLDYIFIEDIDVIEEIYLNLRSRGVERRDFYRIYRQVMEFISPIFKAVKEGISDKEVLWKDGIWYDKSSI